MIITGNHTVQQILKDLTIELKKTTTLTVWLEGHLLASVKELPSECGESSPLPFLSFSVLIMATTDYPGWLDRGEED